MKRLESVGENKISSDPASAPAYTGFDLQREYARVEKRSGSCALPFTAEAEAEAESGRSNHEEDIDGEIDAESQDGSRACSDWSEADSDESFAMFGHCEKQ